MGKKIIQVTTTLFGTFVPVASQAISFEDPSSSFRLGTSDLKGAIINMINWILGLLGIIAVLMILYAGFVILTAGGGDERKVENARTMVAGAIIGLVVILLAWAIVNFALKTTANLAGAG